MDLNELHVFLIRLLRSEPEVVAAFGMGSLITAILAFSLGRLVRRGPDAGAELARKDAEIARKDTELARKDAQVAGLEARMAGVLATPRPGRGPANEARCDELEAEVARLCRVHQAAEADAAGLREALDRASKEAAHWAKWARLHEEEAARLAEADAPAGPPREAEPVGRASWIGRFRHPSRFHR